MLCPLAFGTDDFAYCEPAFRILFTLASNLQSHTCYNVSRVSSISVVYRSTTSGVTAGGSPNDLWPSNVPDTGAKLPPGDAMSTRSSTSNSPYYPRQQELQPVTQPPPLQKHVTSEPLFGYLSADATFVPSNFGMVAHPYSAPTAAGDHGGGLSPRAVAARGSADGLRTVASVDSSGTPTGSREHSPTCDDFMQRSGPISGTAPWLSSTRVLREAFCQ